MKLKEERNLSKKEMKHEIKMIWDKVTNIEARQRRFDRWINGIPGKENQSKGRKPILIIQQNISPQKKKNLPTQEKIFEASYWKSIPYNWEQQIRIANLCVLYKHSSRVLRWEEALSTHFANPGGLDEGLKRRELWAHLIHDHRYKSPEQNTSISNTATY